MLRQQYPSDKTQDKNQTSLVIWDPIIRGILLFAPVAGTSGENAQLAGWLAGDEGRSESNRQGEGAGTGARDG